MQEDSLAACLAIVQDAKLFNDYNDAARLLEQHFPALPSLAIMAFKTSVVSVNSRLDWLGTAAHLELGTIEQLGQLHAMLTLLSGSSYGSLSNAVGVKISDACSNLRDCEGYFHMFSDGAAMTLAPITDVLNQLGYIVAAGQEVCIQKLNETTLRCQELCSAPGDCSFLVHFANNRSALFDAYLSQAWKLTIQEQGEHPLRFLLCVY